MKFEDQRLALCNILYCFSMLTMYLLINIEPTNTRNVSEIDVTEIFPIFINNSMQLNKAHFNSRL